MTMNKEEAQKKLKELEHNKLKIWPAQNIGKNQVAALNPEECGFVSKCDLASYSQWLRAVDVEDFDQSTYVEGTKPKKIKKDDGKAVTASKARAKGGAEDVTTN